MACRELLEPGHRSDLESSSIFGTAILIVMLLVMWPLKGICFNAMLIQYIVHLISPYQAAVFLPVMFYSLHHWTEWTRLTFFNVQLASLNLCYFSKKLFVLIKSQLVTRLKNILNLVFSLQNNLFQHV